MSQKFPIGTRVVVKKNLKLRGKILDYSASWKGIQFHPEKYDVVIDGESFAREMSEDSLALESNLTIEPSRAKLIDKKRVINILDKYLSKRQCRWSDITEMVKEIAAL